METVQVCRHASPSATTTRLGGNLLPTCDSGGAVIGPLVAAARPRGPETGSTACTPLAINRRIAERGRTTPVPSNRSSTSGERIADEEIPMTTDSRVTVLPLAGMMCSPKTRTRVAEAE
jgi:hypothetical protein